MSGVTSEFARVACGPQNHSNYLVAAQDFYTADITWVAPGRSVRIVGRDAVIGQQRREAQAMLSPEFTFLRRSSNERQIIDEFAVRFVYSGTGIDGAPVHAGDLVELKRLRILGLSAGRVSHETCIETWTVLETPR